MSTEKHAIPNRNLRCGKLSGIINDVSHLSFVYHGFHGCVCGETWQRAAIINRTHGVCSTGVLYWFSENNKTFASIYESPQSSSSSGFTNHIITDISIALYYTVRILFACELHSFSSRISCNLFNLPKAQWLHGSEINLSYMESDFTTVITSPIVHSFGGQTLWGRGR